MLTILIFVSLLIGIITLWWYKNVHKPDKHLEKFPGPKTIPIIGNALQIGPLKDILNNLSKMQEQFGGIYKLKIGPTLTNLVLTDEKFVEFLLKSKTILTKAEMYQFFQNWTGPGLVFTTGERWRQHRRILTPAFHSEILKQCIKSFDSAADTLIQKLNEDLNKDSVDILSRIALCALDIIGESTMNVAMNAQNDPDSDYVKSTHELCRITIERTFSPIKMLDWFFRFTKDYWIEKKSMKVLHDYSNSVIKRKKEMLNMNDYDGGKERLGFLDILLTATVNGKPLSDEDVRTEVDTFLFGGHHTIATALNFTIYVLSQHSTIQDNIIKELKLIFGNDQNRAATYEELHKMTYLEMVIKESMRLYPPGPIISRKLDEDVEYDGGILPKGLSLIIFIFGIHRNPKYFPDPEKFDPERFAAANINKLHPYSYLPFGAGPRNCIGKTLAMLEMAFLLSKLLRKFEIVPAIPAHDITLSVEMVLMSVNGVRIGLRERHF